MTDTARRIVAAFAARGLTLAAAESLTGGMLASAIVDVPGASAVFRGGAVVYATDTKASVLGVDAELLGRVGPIDGDVAGQLAGGARRLFGASFGVATTGAAGPDAQDGHEPGEAWVAVAGADGTSSRRHLHLTGDRLAIRAGAVAAALELLAETAGIAGSPSPE